MYSLYDYSKFGVFNHRLLHQYLKLYRRHRLQKYAYLHIIIFYCLPKGDILIEQNIDTFSAPCDNKISDTIRIGTYKKVTIFSL